MPHCIIEYSSDVNTDPSTLINTVFQGALKSELFEESHIKTRAISFDHYQTGAIEKGFIHVSARILSGRTSKQRTLLSQTILAELEKLELSSLTMTVDVVDMNRESYTKKVV